jgi:hypothetical protein
MTLFIFKLNYHSSTLLIDQGNVTEKILSGGGGRVLGIVPFGGAKWTEQRTFKLAFNLAT